MGANLNCLLCLYRRIKLVYLCTTRIVLYEFLLIVNTVIVSCTVS